MRASAGCRSTSKSRVVRNCIRDEKAEESQDSTSSCQDEKADTVPKEKRAKPVPWREALLGEMELCGADRCNLSLSKPYFSASLSYRSCY